MHVQGLPPIPISFGSVVLTLLAVIITVFAFVRALQRGRILWLLAIMATGPIAAIAYWIVSSFSGYSGSTRSVSSWPPRRRR